MGRVVINASDCILGRLASKVARIAKENNEVIIVNCDKAVITGGKKDILNKYMNKLHKGSTEKGPHQPKRPDRFVRRVIRGMINYKSSNGKKAFKRVKTFINVPEKYKKSISKSFKCKKVSQLEEYKHLTVGEICKHIGGHWYE